VAGTGSSDEAIDRLRGIATDSDKIVAFSGAGLSAESGIPTYRGAGGLWSEYDPDKYANINYFLRDPSYYWRFFRDVRYPILKEAKPNEGHLALVEMERQGKCRSVITQNIDGLHSEAGQQQVIELHGNTQRFYCLDCSNAMTMNEAYQLLCRDLPPTCSCGGLIRPDVVFFGESLPSEALEEASRAALECDLFFVLGSSLVVQPAAQLPILAKQRGARLIIINIGATPLDDLADLVFDESASVILSQLTDLSS
jgi:NAD-dependent deacetylase